MAYRFYLTDKGTELLGQLVAGDKVAITKVCFGSGATGDDSPDYTLTELKHPETEKTLIPDTDSALLDPNDNSILCITAELPSEFTGTINEIGYKDDKGNLVFYGNIPEEVVVSHPNKSYKYTNWIAFENQEIDKIEFGVMSPDFGRVEQLVRKLEEEFEPDQFAKKEDLTKIDLSGYVEREEGKSLISSTDLAQITTNKNDIATNKSAISANESAISTNTGNINTNTQNITALQSGKVDKVSGKDLVSTTDITQITTNKNDISTLQTGKVDKVSGKELVSTTDITQITTNKNSISSLTTRITALETTLSGVESLVSSINSKLEAIV